MALQMQTASVPLFGGIDTKTDPKYVASAMMLTAQNVRFYGVSSAQKRYGQTALTQSVGVGGQQITAGKALGVFNNELLAFDGSALFTYAQAAGTWVQRALMTEVLLNTAPIIRTVDSVAGIATALTGSLELYAWDGAGVSYAIRDTTSGSFVVPKTLIDANGSSPQIVVAGSLTYIFFLIGGLLWSVTLNTANPSLGIIARQIISNTATSGEPFIAIGSSGSALSQPTILIVFREGGASSFRVLLKGFDLSSIASTTFAYAPPSAVLHLSAAFTTDGSHCLCNIGSATAAETFTINPANGTTLDTGAAPTTALLKTAAVGSSPTTIDIYWDDQPANSQPQISWQRCTFITPLDITAPLQTVVQGARIASMPVLVGTRVYLLAASMLTNIAGATSQQAAFFLLDGVSLTFVQRFFGGSAAFGGLVLPTLTLSSSGQVFTGVGQKTALRADATGTVYSQVGITACYFTFPTASQVKMVPFNTTAVINCGNTYTYDGAQVVESGFWEFPDGITATAGGTGNLNAGTYIYVVTYEWTDAAGNIHYSAGSYPISVTTTVGQAVTLKVPYTVLTYKQDAVITVYRTATAPGNFATPDTGLGPWFKVGSIPNVLTGTSSVSVIDTASDISLQGQQFMYAPPDGSGEIDNETPPPFSYMVATKTRVFGVAQDDPTALWYTKPVAPGRPAEWTPFFVKRVETDGGAVTGLSALDTQAVIFKRHKIEYLPEDGPNAAGQNDFGPLQLLSSTSGCLASPTILQTSEGIYYESDVGLSQLNRSLTVDPNFGLPVQGLTNSLTLSGAAIISAQNQLRWTSIEGTALVYDYVTSRWSTYTNYDAVGYVLWQDRGTRLRSTGQTLYEDVTTYLDNNQPIVIVLETSWQKVAQLAQGFGAVWYASILGDYVSSHTLNVEVAWDYLDAAFQTATWNATANGNLGTFGSSATFGSDPVYGANIAAYTAPYQLRIALSRQVGESIKFKIYDSGISGQSCTLNEIAIQLGVIGGLNRVPSRQQV